jgi:hypothetical protein
MSSVLVPVLFQMNMALDTEKRSLRSLLFLIKMRAGSLVASSRDSTDFVLVESVTCFRAKFVCRSGINATWYLYSRVYSVLMPNVIGRELLTRSFKTPAVVGVVFGGSYSQHGAHIAIFTAVSLIVCRECQ